MRALQRHPGLTLQLGCSRLLATRAAGTPMVMKAAKAEGYGESATSLIAAESFRFVVDEPPRMGGKGIGPNPLTLLLGSLIGCTQFTASMIAREMKLGNIGTASWAAAGEYDLRGVRGTEPGVDARFTCIGLEGTFDTTMSQQELDRIAEQIDKRCIVAATLKASGLELQLSMKKGVVDHECEPACVLHRLEEQGGTTGQVNGHDADAPHFVGRAGQGRASAHGFATLACRGFFTSPSWQRAEDGEDVARVHMRADVTPQLQKETSNKGAATTDGGAYSSRDDPHAQASQPTEGKSGEQIVQEQSAGATVHPQTAGNVEGGKPMGRSARSPSYAGGEAAGSEAELAELAEAAEDKREEEELGREIDRTDFEPWAE